MGLASSLGTAAGALGATAAGAAVTGAEPVAAGAGLLAGAAKVGQWAMLLAPLISDFFSGSGNDDEAAKKIASARDGLAARLSAAERIPLSQAQQAVDEQLKPLIEQHAQDAGGKAGRVVNDALSAAGGFAIGRGMGAAGKMAKGAATAAKVEQMATQAAPAAESAAEDVITARQMAQKQMMDRAATGEMDSVRGVREGAPARLTYDEPEVHDALPMDTDDMPPGQDNGGMRQLLLEMQKRQMLRLLGG